MTVEYTNWKGQTRKRVIRPLGLRWSSNEFHPEAQWLMQAVDVEDGKVKYFSMKNIHSWGTYGE